MQTLTLKELAEWAKTQPPDRKVMMHRYKKWHIDRDKEECGCLMFQYAQDSGLEPTYCDTGNIYVTDDQMEQRDAIAIQLDAIVWRLFSSEQPKPADFPQTFGELVKLFKPEYQ